LLPAFAGGVSVVKEIFPADKMELLKLDYYQLAFLTPGISPL
jgi:hypothetical protein